MGAGSVTSAVRQRGAPNPAAATSPAVAGTGYGAAANQVGPQLGANVAELDNAPGDHWRRSPPAAEGKPPYYRNESFGVGGALHQRDAEAIRNVAAAQAGTPGTAGRLATPYRRNESHGVG